MKGRLTFTATWASSDDHGRSRRARQIAGTIALVGAAVLGTLVSRVPRAGVAEALNFGSHAVGIASDEQTIAVANTGSVPLNVSAITMGGDHPHDFLPGAEDCTQAALDPGRPCSIAVRFRPLAADARRATLLIFDDSRDSPHMVALAGTGVSEAQLTATPAVLRFTQQGVGTASDPQWITLGSQADAPFAIAGISADLGRPGSFRIAKDECTNAQIAAGSECRVGVVFAPQRQGMSSGRVTFRPVSGQPVTAALEGIAPAAPTAVSFAADPHEIAFEPQQVYTGSPARTITVTSTGTAPLRVSRIGLAGSDSGDFRVAGDGCSERELPRGDRCAIQVRFAPTAAGPRSAALSIASNAAGGSAEVQLSGAGEQRKAPVRSVNVQPTQIDFGAHPAGEIATDAITVRSTGTAPVTIGDIVLRQRGRATFQKRDDNCSNSVLEPGSPCRITIAFAPAAQVRAEALLVIPHDAPGAALQIPITGAGFRREPETWKRLDVRPAALEFQPSLVRAARMARGPEIPHQAIVMRSTGTAPVQLSGIGKTGPAANDFLIEDRSNCASGQLAPGAACEIEIGFRPGGLGERRAVLLITHDAPGSPAQVNIAGAGIQPQPQCASLAAVRIEPAIASRISQYEGDVQLTGFVKNTGAADFESAAGRQEIRLFEVGPGSSTQRLLARLPFNRIPAGGELPVRATVRWRTANEFPPSYRLEIAYAPELSRAECRAGSSTVTLPSGAIQELFRAPESGRFDRILVNPRVLRRAGPDIR